MRLRFLRAVAASAVLFCTSCASGYKASYVAGAVTKELTTEAYAGYSEHFNDRLESCDPANNGDIKTKSDFDECMGPAYGKETHDKIEEKVVIYHQAALLHSEVMEIPEAPAQERAKATEDVFVAAQELLKLFPDGEKLIKKLKRLTGRK